MSDGARVWTLRELLDGFGRSPVTVTIRTADGREIVATGTLDDLTFGGSTEVIEVPAPPARPHLPPIAYQRGRTWLSLNVRLEDGQVTLPLPPVPT